MRQVQLQSNSACVPGAELQHVMWCIIREGFMRVVVEHLNGVQVSPLHCTAHMPTSHPISADAGYSWCVRAADDDDGGSAVCLSRCIMHDDGWGVLCRVSI